MKNISIKILGLVAIVALLSSCKKWVDYDPHDDFLITELDYLKSESDYRTMAISVYTPIQWINQAVPVGDIASDNAVSGGENASDVLSLQQIDDFTHTPINSTLTELWQAPYEGINRATAPNDVKARGYLNQVRERAFGNAANNINSSGATLRQAIWDERRLELGMEGDRFFDLVRTGQAATKITGFVAGKHELFPIPQVEVDISGLTQNPRY